MLMPYKFTPTFCTSDVDGGDLESFYNLFLNIRIVIGTFMNDKSFSVDYSICENFFADESTKIVIFIRFK